VLIKTIWFAAVYPTVLVMTLAVFVGGELSQVKNTIARWVLWFEKYAWTQLRN